jgi:hypothetical protein
VASVFSQQFDPSLSLSSSLCRHINLFYYLI